MTIKQQGGIFGRNPTFNNVDVDGVLTVDTITEKTGASGVTLDGVTLKDGNVVLANGKASTSLPPLALAQVNCSMTMKRGHGRHPTMHLHLPQP
jgi:hypothetical protein